MTEKFSLDAIARGGREGRRRVKRMQRPNRVRRARACGAPDGARPDGGETEGRSSDLLIVPGTRHALEEVEDSVILLTVSK